MLAFVLESPDGRTDILASVIIPRHTIKVLSASDYIGRAVNTDEPSRQSRVWSHR